MPKTDAKAAPTAEEPKKKGFARKTSELPTRIWTFGCHAPIEGLKDFDDQLYLGHKFKNKLVELELLRRKKVRDFEASFPGTQQQEAKRQVLLDEKAEIKAKINAIRQEKRGNAKLETAKLTARSKQISADLKVVKDQIKVIKTKIRTTAKNDAVYEAIDAEITALAKAASAESGVYWGTKLLAQNAIQQAARGKMDPRFKPYRKEGRVGIQAQKKRIKLEGVPREDCPAIELKTADLFNESSNLIRIDPVDEKAYHGTRGERRRLCRTFLHLRVKSDENDGPVWAKFPLHLHREIPKDAVIKWAWVKRMVVGTDFRYEFQLTLESKQFKPASSKDGDDAVAINFGWRSLEKNTNKLRIAYLGDTNGNYREIQIPADVPDRLDHVDSLRSIRDRHFDDIKAVLSTRLKEKRQLPEWFTTDLKFIDLWRSTAKLDRVVWAWRNQRFSGDDIIFAAAEAWRQKNRHLYQWEANERDKVLARRKDFYRNMALQIARQYSTVVIDNFNLSHVARLPEAGDEETKDPQKQRHNRHAMALSEFRSILKVSCASEGTNVVVVDAEFNTIDCNECGSRLDWDAAKEIEHTCEACGVRWDQDKNNCINLLKRAGFDVGAAKKGKDRSKKAGKKAGKQPGMRGEARGSQQQLTP